MTTELAIEPVTAERAGGDPPVTRLDGLEAGRGLAALAVTMFHATGVVALDKYFALQDLWHAFRWGDAGVDFFFVLSGFVITIAHARDVGRPARVLPYLTRRAWRVYPSYWLVFGVVWLTAALAPSLHGTVPMDVGVLLRALALLPQDPALVGGTGAPVVVVAWSLQYELAFYLAFAVLIASWRVGVLLFVAAAAFTFAQPADSFPRTFLASPHLLQFALGAAAAVVHLRRAVPRGGWLAFAGAILFAAIAMAVVREALAPGVARVFAYGVASAAIVLGLASAERAGRLHVPAPLVHLGTLSYALYLVHFPVLSLLAKIGLATGVHELLPGAVLPLALVAVCVAAAQLLHLGFERPLAELRRRSTAR